VLKTNLKLSKDIKNDNAKVFCKKIDRVIKSLIGHKLITFTVIDNKLNFCERIYSNNNKIYPILGQKKMPKNIWSKKVLKNKKHFLCKNKKDIKKIYYDYEKIFSLGCGSIINLLVLFKGKPIGTINILHKENHYSMNDLKKIDFLITYLIPFFLDHQKIMQRKIT
jgi:hypothetical protein